MAQAALIASAAAPIFGGMQEKANAEAEAQHARINSFIARTRAIQEDTTHRVQMSDELGTMRAALAANGQKPGVGTLDFMREMKRERLRARRIGVGNRMSEAADFNTQERNAKLRGRTAMLGGFVKAGPSLFNLMQTV